MTASLFISKRIISGGGALGSLYFSRLVLGALRSISSSSNVLEEGKDGSFVVSYLISSCGLSLESARLVSKGIKFESSERPDSVLELLRNKGFEDKHIAKVIRSRPPVLLFNAEKTLVPKFDYFHSVGFSKDDVVKMVSSNPVLLVRSLDNYFIPLYELLKSVLISSEKVVSTLKRCNPRSITRHPQDALVPNLAFLRSSGIPETSIHYLVSNFLGIASSKPSQFEAVMEEVRGLGFDASKISFVHAMYVLTTQGTKSEKWKTMLEVYVKWGWSKADWLAAFRKCPWCMVVSHNKVARVMEFLVKEMGWTTKDVAKTPIILTFSLEKRVIPRCYVIRALQAEGLVKDDLKFSTFIFRSEEAFRKKFVSPFDGYVPQLLDLYCGKISFGI